MHSTRCCSVIGLLAVFSIACTSAFKSAESAGEDSYDEEESDDVTLLAMPMKSATKKIAQHRAGGAGQIHEGDAPSLFQVDEVVATVPASEDIVQVELEQLSDQRYQAMLESKPLHAPGASEKAEAQGTASGALDRRMMQSVVALGIFFTILVLGQMVFLSQSKEQGTAAASTEIRKKVRSMRVSTKQEILGMFESGSADGDGADQSNAGILRIEGRVVARSCQTMVTPFSDRQCVMYSASASQKRQDGVHQPPLAYHAACMDFAIQLADADGPLQISIHGHDAALFEMFNGRYSQEAAFSDVAESWRGFALAHLIHGKDASCNALSCVDFGAKGALEFCESALLDGAAVTCVGEVTRDRNGDLCLCPWRPPIGGLDEPPSAPLGKAKGFLGKLMTTSWERRQHSKPSPLAGQVLISDSPALLGERSNFWQQVKQGFRRWLSQ